MSGFGRKTGVSLWYVKKERAEQFLLNGQGLHKEIENSVKESKTFATI